MSLFYKENPKTRGSGIICAIPQRGTCPNKCSDCFFQSGRSYLEPLEDNLPNMPTYDDVEGRVVRVNDGNDSNVQRDLVISETARYPLRFYNTAIPSLDFPAPVVLTVNPGEMTDEDFHGIDEPPINLMFVRIRTNTWNMATVARAVAYYTSRDVPVVLTFMAYFDQDISPQYRRDYEFRKRTLNSYWCITKDAYARVMERFKDDFPVYSCSGPGPSGCKHCGNCLREYFATMERMQKNL